MEQFAVQVMGIAVIAQVEAYDIEPQGKQLLRERQVSSARATDEFGRRLDNFCKLSATRRPKVAERLNLGRAGTPCQTTAASLDVLRDQAMAASGLLVGCAAGSGCGRGRTPESVPLMRRGCCHCGVAIRAMFVSVSAGAAAPPLTRTTPPEAGASSETEVRSYVDSKKGATASARRGRPRRRRRRT